MNIYSEYLQQQTNNKKTKIYKKTKKLEKRTNDSKRNIYIDINRYKYNQTMTKMMIRGYTNHIFIYRYHTLCVVTLVLVLIVVLLVLLLQQRIGRYP